TETEKDPGIDRDLSPQAIGVAAEITRRCLPDFSDLPFEGDVPLLDAGRVDVGGGGAKRSERDELRIRRCQNRVRIPAKVCVRIVETAWRIFHQGAVAKWR